MVMLLATVAVFLSTPSARRATRCAPACKMTNLISIHALREEGDTCKRRIISAMRISIHALREEGDFRN